MNRSYQRFAAAWAAPATRSAAIERYASHQSSFVHGLLPELALRLDANETLEILRARLGASTVEHALDPRFTDPDASISGLPSSISSPVQSETHSAWLKGANVVGVNARTCASSSDATRSKHGGSFWGVVKYALTLSDAQDTIHLLPFWEPGVAGSLYGPSSWELFSELLSEELASAYPHLDSPARQLRATVNLLHALGKRVGFEVLPHVDRFAETVLVFPAYFEWLCHRDGEIVSHRADLHRTAEDLIFRFVRDNGSAGGGAVPATRLELFGRDVDERARLELLFGPPTDHARRAARRLQIIEELHRAGLEPVPATMAPPFRGLRVSPDAEAKTVDAQGRIWREYVMQEPTLMSRVFGPLTRFKLYEPSDDNRGWALDFGRPRREVWEYVTRKYAEFQQRFDFDFMRGDMAHVQMRPRGVPGDLSVPELRAHYHLMRAVKEAVSEKNRAPYFAYFAESFLHGRDVFGYGEELDHLEASLADVALGDLHACEVRSGDFVRRLRRYHDWMTTRSTAPAATMMTSDKDDPRFDRFYRAGSELRFFLGLFLTDMPSYMSLGFETRDVHLKPADNEFYTKLYVFDQSSGPNATRGPYAWGKNEALFSVIEDLRALADQLLREIGARPVRWLLPPDATAQSSMLAWTHVVSAPRYVFVACTDTEHGTDYFGLPHVDAQPAPPLELLHSTVYTGQDSPPEDRKLVSNGRHYRVEGMAPGECRVYRVAGR